MVHPVQSVVESLYAAGRCPRLHVNALTDGVVCPDFIREQWQERLIIDLDASYPLDLTFDDHGIAADLSFGGYVTRCTFPWRAVYVVADRATGRGIVLEQNMPESVRRSRHGVPPTTGPLQEDDEVGSKLEAVPEGEEHPSASDAPIAEETASAAPDGEGGDNRDEEQVKKRRAAFRVIDGGS